MYPLDFEEFLWAIGVQTKFIDMCREAFTNKQQIDEFIIKTMNEKFRDYMIIGGMPKVISEFVKEKRYISAIERQKDLIKNYKADVIKYSSNVDKQKILATFSSIPLQLAKKNKKFVYSEIRGNENKKGYEKYFSSLCWLRDAGIIHFCYTK